MRLHSVAAALLTLLAPAAARAQAPTAPEMFSDILLTYQVSGCGQPDRATPTTFPCVDGLVTYGVLQSGRYATRFDLLADFRNPPASFAGIRAINVSPMSSWFGLSFASSPVGCYGQYSDGRCNTYLSISGLGAFFGNTDARVGPTVNVSTYVNDVFFLAAGEDPGSLRVERLQIGYDYRGEDAGGGFSGTYLITPTVTLTPEPSALALTAAGLAAAGAAVRRRRARA